MQAIKVLCTIGLQGAFLRLISDIEFAAKCRLDVQFGIAAAFLEEIEHGLTFDLAILTRGASEALAARGKTSAASIVDIARSGLGLAVRSNAPKPDITSVDKLKVTLLSAASIASSKNGLAGMYFIDVLRELGLSADIAPKIKWETAGGYAAKIAARGDAEMAVQLVSEILPVTGVDLVGPFPKSVQKYAVLSSCIALQSAADATAKAVVDCLRAGTVEPTLRRFGLEPCR